jgi:hypothetical protein
MPKSNRRPAYHPAGPWSLPRTRSRQRYCKFIRITCYRQENQWRRNELRPDLLVRSPRRRRQQAHIALLRVTLNAPMADIHDNAGCTRPGRSTGIVPPAVT